jgi:type VI protein secretion system component VasK
MNNLARWMVALGVVAASVGFVFLGLGLSFVQPESSEITIGWALMAGGAVVGLLGWVLFKRTEGPDTSVVEPGMPDLDGSRR